MVRVNNDRLPDLCRRQILSHCSPASFVALRQTCRTWHDSASDHILQCSLSKAVGEDLRGVFADPAVYERAFKRLVRYENLHQRRTHTLQPPVQGLHNFQFSADGSQLVAIRWGRHLCRWDVLDNRVSYLHEAVNRFVFGANRSELYAVESTGSVFLMSNVGSFEEDEEDLHIGFSGITLGFSIHQETGYFAAGSLGGVGAMGNLFDPTERTELPRRNTDSSLYEALVVENGGYVLYTGPSDALHLTPMHAPEASRPAPAWFRLDRFRRSPHFTAPDVLLHQGGIAVVDFARSDLPVRFVLQPSRNITDMQPLGEIGLWATIDQKRNCMLWDSAFDPPQLVWRKKMKQNLTRLWVGAAPNIFLIQDETDHFFVFSWRETSAWFHGKASSRHPNYEDRMTADVSEDGCYILLADNWQPDVSPSVTIKRIVPRSPKVPFEEVAAFYFTPSGA